MPAISIIGVILRLKRKTDRGPTAGTAGYTKRGGCAGGRQRALVHFWTGASACTLVTVNSFESASTCALRRNALTASHMTRDANHERWQRTPRNVVCDAATHIMKRGIRRVQIRRRRITHNIGARRESDRQRTQQVAYDSTVYRAS